MLTEKAKQQEALIEEYESRYQEYEQLASDAMDLKNENEEINEQLEK